MFSDLVYRLRSVFRRKVVEQELDEELRFHLEQQMAKLVRSGVSADEASRLARLALQGPEQAKERCRDERRTFLWDSTLQDLRYSLRQLRSAPGFAIAAIFIMSLGIGANTAIFSLLDAVVLRSLPVRDPQQLIVPRWTAKETPSPYDSDDYESCFASKVPDAKGSCTFPYSVFRLFEQQQDVFSDVTAFAGPIPLTANANGPAVANAEIVSSNFFRTLGKRSVLGRTFNERDDTPAANATVVLSHAYWLRAFGGDTSVVGKTMRLNAVPFTIIGVAEQGFNHLSPGRVCDFWMPIHASDRLGISWLSIPLHSAHRFWLRIMARVRPGITMKRAEAELNAVFKNEMVSQSRVLKADASVEITSANTALTGVRERLGTPLYLLMSAVGLVLLIACSNVAGLMIARTSTRQKEIAIRLALGAARSRIVRQLLTESILLAITGGLAGLVIALFGTRLLVNFLPFHLNVTPDLRVISFAALISVASGVFFGTIPALRATRLRRSSASPAGHGLEQMMSPVAPRRWFRNSLVVIQVALAFVMLVGAGLFMRSLFNLKNINPGFNPQHVLLFGLDPASLRYKNEQIQSLYRMLRDRIGSMPGVTGVTYSQSALLDGSSHSTHYKVQGRSDGDPVQVGLLNIGPDSLGTMGIPLLTGRSFTRDEFAYERPVVMVNQTFVTRYLAGRNPIELHIGGKGIKDVQHQIVGVVGDIKHVNLRDKVPATAYRPLAANGAHFEVRVVGNPSALIPAMTKIVRQVDSNLPLFDVKTQTEQIDELLGVERLIARLAAGFALLALTLACIGLYSLLSYEVTRRTREIGIRIAMGAQPGLVQRAILRETLTIVLIGLAVGLPAALFATRALSAMLYGVHANDPVALLVITVILLAITTLAAYLPARRASLIDPVAALRSE